MMERTKRLLPSRPFSYNIVEREASRLSGDHTGYSTGGGAEGVEDGDRLPVKYQLRRRGKVHFATLAAGDAGDSGRGGKVEVPDDPAGDGGALQADRDPAAVRRRMTPERHFCVARINVFEIFGGWSLQLKLLWASRPIQGVE